MPLSSKAIADDPVTSPIRMHHLCQATLVLALLLNFQADAQINEDETTIELAFVVFRHGERVPEINEQFPKDEYTIDHFKPLTYGQVTKEGKKRQYALGKKLRKRYDSFLGKVYMPEAVETHSTDWDRTKMSALLVLAGLFPPSKSERWDDELQWQPIPYNFKSSADDHLIQRPDFYCPRYVKELKKVFKSGEVRKILRKNKKIFNYVTKSTGKNMTNLHEVFRIYQNLRSKESLNMRIPSWARKVYPEPLHTIASYQCLFENYNTLLRRLNGGHMLQKFIIASQQKINGTLTPSGRKIYLYSGHENDVVKILAVLNVYAQHLPPYSSTVMLELRRSVKTGEYGFMVFYDNSTYTDEVHSLVMPGCEAFCEMHKFLELTKPVVPVNYTAECDSNVYLD